MPAEIDKIESRLCTHVQILAGLIGERNSRRPSALEATRAYISRQITDSGLKFTEHRYAISCREAVNIEVEMSGSSPEEPCLIVGAHYDTAEFTPGADDNASAVAALLEIVRSLPGKKIKRRICCIFYDCEEWPHFATGEMGSYHDAETRRKRGERIYGMICLESIGYFPNRVSPDVDRPAFIRCLDWLIGGKYIVIVSDFRSVPFGLPFLMRFLTSGFFRCIPAALPQSLGIIALSDHRSYWDQGFRALMVTNTALFRNPNYHQPSDIPVTLDYRRLTKLTRMLSRAILRTCT